MFILSVPGGTGRHYCVEPLGDPESLEYRDFRHSQDESEGDCRGKRASHNRKRQGCHQRIAEVIESRMRRMLAVGTSNARVSLTPSR